MICILSDKIGDVLIENDLIPEECFFDHGGILLYFSFVFQRRVVLCDKCRVLNACPVYVSVARFKEDNTCPELPGLFCPLCKSTKLTLRTVEELIEIFSPEEDEGY